jgi:hypothetical protein
VTDKWTKAHTHTRTSFDQGFDTSFTLLSPLPFYPDDTSAHAGLLFDAVELDGDRMGGDEYRSMGNLISRTFVDLRHKQVVAVAEMGTLFR